MAINSLLARVGLRLGTLGTAASLAIACPTAEGNVAQTAHTAATRTGFYFPTNASIGTVVNGAEAMRTWSNGGVQIGGAFNASPGASTLLVSANGGVSLPAVIAGVQLWLAGADAAAVDTYLMLDAFSSTNNGSLTGRRARGTASAPTTVQASDVLLSVLGYGYGASGYSAISRGRIQIVASQAWTDTVQGTQLQFSITTNGGITTYAAMVLGNDNSLTLGLAGSNKGSLVFPNASNTNTVSIAPGVTSASYSLTLPLAQAVASGYVLANDGTGVLSWAPPGAAGNLTGPITSVGLATSIAAQTGTGSTFVVQNAPTVNGLTIADPTTTSKTLTFNLAGASASTALTIASSQTANRTATIPVLAAADTFGMIGTAATWTGVQTLELPFIADATDATKRIGFTLSGASTSTTLTIVSAQTTNRNLTVPVLTANDTIATLAAANTFTGSAVFSGTTTMAAAGGFRLNGNTATTAQGVSGNCGLYRVLSTLQPVGSLILQSDVGQATSGVAIYVGTTPTVGATFFTSAASLGTIASTYTGVVLAGVQTSLAAVAGQVGEVLNGSNTSSYTNFTTTATYQQIASIALTAGDWLITATTTFSSASATLTAGTNAIFAISTSTASATGAVEGVSIAYVAAGLLSGLTGRQTDTLNIRVQVASSTNYFLNGQATFTLGNPQFVGSLTATRMR